MAKIIWCPGEAEEKESGAKAEGVGKEKRQRDVDKEREIPDRPPAVKEDKLEVKYEGAWFSAELTFRDGAAVVLFEDYPEEEGDVWDLERMKSLVPDLHETIRVTSSQLQDDECSKVKLRMIVCAFKQKITTEEGGTLPEGWFDAIVTAVRKEPHGDECCCSFTVEWLNAQDSRREEKLKCGDICLISNKSVETHPIVVELLQRVRDAERAGAEGQKTSSSKPSSSKRRPPKPSAKPNAPKSRGRKRKSDIEAEKENYNEDEIDNDNAEKENYNEDEIDNDNENEIDNDSDRDPDYAPNIEEQDRVPFYTQPKRAQKSKAFSKATSSRGRMRGSISSNRYFTQT